MNWIRKVVRAFLQAGTDECYRVLPDEKVGGEDIFTILIWLLFAIALIGTATLFYFGR